MVGQTNDMQNQFAGSATHSKPELNAGDFRGADIPASHDEGSTAALAQMMQAAQAGGETEFPEIATAPSLESQSQGTRSTGLRGAFDTWAQAPDQIGQTFGVSGITLGGNGTIFDRQAHQDDQRRAGHNSYVNELIRQNQQNTPQRDNFQAQADQMNADLLRGNKNRKDAASSPAQTESGHTRAQTRYDQQRAAKIEQTREQLKVASKSRAPKSHNPAGRSTLLNTERTPATQGNSVNSPLEKLLSMVSASIQSATRRAKAMEAHEIAAKRRNARKQATGPKGLDRISESAAQSLDTIQQLNGGLDWTAGE